MEDETNKKWEFSGDHEKLLNHLLTSHYQGGISTKWSGRDICFDSVGEKAIRTVRINLHEYVWVTYLFTDKWIVC